MSSGPLLSSRLWRIRDLPSMLFHTDCFHFHAQISFSDDRPALPTHRALLLVLTSTSNTRYQPRQDFCFTWGLMLSKYPFNLTVLQFLSANTTLNHCSSIPKAGVTWSTTKDNSCRCSDLDLKLALCSWVNSLTFLNLCFLILKYELITTS